ncbi:hypothetical protein Bbelb_417640 [Branchiostoma belcheri]|nr:hypothetical protein Bbelb_417640 [Branchiostoma belcheri]
MVVSANTEPVVTVEDGTQATEAPRFKSSSIPGGVALAGAYWAHSGTHVHAARLQLPREFAVTFSGEFSDVNAVIDHDYPPSAPGCKTQSGLPSIAEVLSPGACRPGDIDPSFTNQNALVLHKERDIYKAVWGIPSLSNSGELAKNLE